ncbi:MAG: c-type cytochrome [Pseudomonadota bacterium]
MTPQQTFAGRTGTGLRAALLAALALGAVAAHADLGNGARLYNTHCAGCHGVRGIPVMPGAPAFARGERLMQPDQQLLQTLRTGKNAMPAFLGILSERDMMDVISYLRTFR